jgi:hypothetical protein
MKRQLILPFFAGILGTMVLGTWATVSVQAQSKPVPPKFTTVTNLAEFNLVIDKKPVSPMTSKKLMNHPQDGYYWRR